MKSKSQWSARLLIMVCLALGTTSWLYGQKIDKQLDDLHHEQSKLTKESRTMAQSVQSMAQKLHPDAQQVQLTPAFSDVLLAVMQNRVEYGVMVTSVMPYKNPGNSGVVQTSRLKENVPDTQVGSIRINLHGTYSDYDGLLHYIKALRKEPLSIVYLKVEDKSFELGLRVYGN